MERIQNFEALRGILALWVISFHIFMVSGYISTDVGPFGFLADGLHPVNVFIVMSGFVIFLLLDAQKETYAQFLYRRFFRLFPAYLTCLAVFIAWMGPFMHAIKALPWHTEGLAGEIAAFESSFQFFWPHLLTHLTLLHGACGKFLPYSSFVFLGPAWSLSLEWQFYLIAPLVWTIIHFKKTALTLALLLFAGIAFWKFQGGEHMGFLPQKLPFFALGIASFYVWKFRNAPVKQSHKYLSLLALVLFAGLVSRFESPFAVGIWMAVFMLSYMGRDILNQPVLLYLSKVSYSMYIGHMIIIYAGVMILNALGITHQLTFFTLLWCGVIPVTIGLSHLLFHYIEKPCIAFAKKPFGRTPLPA